jgi:hypothetical protein
MSLSKCIAVGLVFVAVGCGSSNSGGTASGGSGGTASGGSGGATCGNNTNVQFKEPCATCVASHCNSQASSCFGSGWRSADFSGTCGPWLQCACNCGNNDVACMTNCGGKETAACTSCQNDVQMCELQSCQQQCLGVGGAGGTASAG